MNKKGLIGFLVVMIFVMIVVGWYVVLVYSSVEYETIKIKDKERTERSGYLIFTQNEIFKNGDDLWFMKFDSSDIYNELEVGKTYRVKVNWFRVPFLSYYRNILELNDVKLGKGDAE